MSKEKHIHTIATAHLDTVWNWDFERTVKNYIPHTLNWNFHLFEKYPEYVFNFEGAYRYELMEEYYPEQFEKLKEYVASGNWYPCGAGWENGDVNVPSPEALFRNFLLGNNYFEEKFGIRSRDVFLPDCFGFGYALPSIARHSNLYGFTTQKLTWGSAYGQPFDIGKWYGPDGKYIIASVKMHNYVAVLGNIRKTKSVAEKLKENEPYGLYATEIFHGIGDRGGGPLPISVRNVCKCINKNNTSDIKIHSSPSDKVFKEIMTEMSEADRDKLPSWNNELLLTDHGTAGYTARTIGKRWNRRGEELADMAERAAVTSDWLGASEYPQKEINNSWKRIINHQFHDDLPGTSVQRAYLRSWNDYGLSINQLAHEYENAVSSVISLLDTSFCKGIPVVVNNSLEFSRNNCVTAVIDGKYENITVYNSEGNIVPSQVCSVTEDKTTIAFIADMPAHSYCVFDVIKCDSPSDVKTNLRVSEKSLENERYKVTLNENGDIGSIFDKNLERELLSAPVVLGIFDNYTGGWLYPAWEVKYKQSIRNHNRIPQLVETKIIENGPARCVIQVIQKCDDSLFINNISLSAGSDTVEVQSEIDWNNQRSLCKNIFSFTCSNEEAIFDLGLGAIKRGNATPEIYEVPAQKWVDLTDKSGNFGVSVLSDCKYGWDKFSDNTLRMTVIHTPLNNSRPAAVQSMMDLGLNRYGYAVCAHKGDDVTRIQQAAREFSSPMTAFVTDKHNGILGSCYSFAEISDNGIIVRAIKKAEYSDEIVVRVNEGCNKTHKSVKLTLGNGIASAREIYASEEYIREATVENGSLIFDMSPYEVRSFALTLISSEEKEKTSSASFVSLPCNTKAISSNTSRLSNGIHGKNYTIPAELIPDVIRSGGVDFMINKDEYDSLLADGQTISLNGDYNKLCILCASLDGDKEYTIIVDDKPVKLTVSDIEERPYAWDLYGMKRTAKIKTDVIGWECTHTHSEKGDDYAHQLFFFKYEIDTNGAKSITLPCDKNLFILAATQINTDCECKCVTPLYDTVKPRKYTFRIKGIKAKLNYLYRKAIAFVWKIDDIGRIFYIYYRP